MGVLSAGILLLIVMCDAGKRNLRYRLMDWKFGDETMGCLFQTIDSLATVAEFNYDTGICITGDEYNRSINATAALQLKNYEPFIVASNSVEVNVIPPVLNLWPSFRNGPMTPRIIARIPGEAAFEDARILVEFIDTLNVTNLAVRMDFNGIESVNTSFKDGEHWQLASSDRLRFTASEGGTVILIFYLKMDTVSGFLNSRPILEFNRTFQPYHTIRFSSNFATCDRIFFNEA